jgi:anaphase-promoting complex subunit 11
MSDRNSPPPFELGGTTPRTPAFDRDSPSHNPGTNEELVTPPLPLEDSVQPYWKTLTMEKLMAQSMEFASMLVYRPNKEHLTEKVNNAVEKIIAVKPSKTKLKLKVNRITLTASWKWRDSKDDDACGICRGAFEACCTNCKLPGDGCPLALGECNHSFHLHCINKWIDSQANPSCPLCRTEWKSVPPSRRSRSPSPRRSSASPPYSMSRSPTGRNYTPIGRSLTPTPNPSSNNSSIVSPPRLNYPSYTPGSISHSPATPIYDPMEED